MHKVGSFLLGTGGTYRFLKGFLCMGSKCNHLSPARSFFIRVLTVSESVSEAKAAAGTVSEAAAVSETEAVSRAVAEVKAVLRAEVVSEADGTHNRFIAPGH